MIICRNNMPTRYHGGTSGSANEKVGAMTRTTCQRPIGSSHQRGLAIGLILAVCLLVGALGVALTLSARSGPVTSENNKNKALATALIVQAARYKDGYFASEEVKGQWGSEPDDSTSPTYAMSDPQYGFMEHQHPPPDAYISAGSALWIYKYNYSTGSAVVYLENVGTENMTDLLVATANLKLGVCQQINQQLLGSTAIPAPSNASNTSTNWSTTANAVDLRGASAVSGIVAACIKTTDGQYVYYSTLRGE